MGSITIIGLGPGRSDLITLAAWQEIKSGKRLLLRTAKHPSVARLTEEKIDFTTYDDFYDRADDFETLYEAIADDVINKAAGKDIVYAVPGSPLVAERTVVLIREKIAARGKSPDFAGKAEEIILKILPGMSFLELMYTRLELDPIGGMTIMDANGLDQLPIDWPTGLIVTQVYDAAAASAAKLSLMEYLPDDYPLIFVKNLGLDDEIIKEIPLFELDRQKGIDHLTSLYVPPRPKSSPFDLLPLIEVMKTLRSPGGCPWDIAQTHESIRRDLIEECYEVIEAIDMKDMAGLCEELGDLLMQIVFQARMAEESGCFTMQDVVEAITNKLIRRHPHVFGDISVADAAEVMINWDKIKKLEKPERKSVIDGIPRGLPALIYAEKLQKKAAKVGFDWADIGPVWEKCAEEIAELKTAVAKGEQAEIEEEFGDILFAFVNLARFLKIDSELSLVKANRKFRRRFLHVEARVNALARPWTDFSLSELDAFWDEAKREEK